MEPKKDKLAYRAPRLTVFGQMKALTASGSAGKRENRVKPERDARP